MKSSALACMKYTRLQARLGWSDRSDVTGVLEMLWQFTAANAITGAIGKFADDDIAAWCGWRRSFTGAEWIEILIECGWIDRCDRHRLVIHDWHDHCPQYVKGNLARYGVKFANLPDDDHRQPISSHHAKHPTKHGAKSSGKDAAKHGSQDTANDSAKDGARPDGRTATKPNLTKPNLPPPPTPSIQNGGGGGTNVVVNPEWVPVAADLRTLGVTTAEPTAAMCASRGCTVEWAKAVIEHYRAKPGAWTPQFLAWRLREGDPQIAPGDGWPPPAESYGDAKAKAEKAKKTRDEGEDTAVFVAIKSGRKEGKSDEAIRRELLDRGLKAALIRFGWLGPDGEPPTPVNFTTQKPPAPLAKVDENPF